MPINEKQKYPDDKKRYDKNYLRLYGKKCNFCEGLGYEYIEDGKGRRHRDCPMCNGIGYIPKDKK